MVLEGQQQQKAVNSALPRPKLGEMLALTLHFEFEKLVFQQIRISFTGHSARGIKEPSVLWHLFRDLFDLFQLIRFSEDIVARGIKSSDRGEKTGAFLLAERGAERVDGDIDRSSVRLKGEKFGHGLGGRTAQCETEAVEIFQVGFVQGITDDFNVEIV